MTRLQRIAYTLSVATCAFIYGFVSRGLELPPYDFLYRAAAQEQVLLRDPAWTAPKVYQGEGVTTPSYFDGLVLISSFWKSDDGWESGVRLLAPDGATVQGWPVPHESLFPTPNPESRPFIGIAAVDNMSKPDSRHIPLHGTHLTPSGDLLVIVPHEGIARLRPCGDIGWQLQNGAHHSIEPASDSTYWVPTDQYLTEDDSADRYSGLTSPLRVDRVVQISGDGTVLDSLNVLEIIQGQGLAEYIYRAGRSDDPDVTHLNDADPLPDSLAGEYPQFEAGDLLLSLRNLSMVLVVDPETKNVRWWESRHLVRQHDPDWMGDGWIGVYDNRDDGTQRGAYLGGSRIVALRPSDDSVRVIHQGTFHSHRMGKWQRLSDDRYLITESTAGRAFVIENGKTTWEWQAPTYGEDRVPRVAEATQYAFDQSDVRNWSCDDSSAQ